MHADIAAVPQERLAQEHRISGQGEGTGLHELALFARRGADSPSGAHVILRHEGDRCPDGHEQVPGQRGQYSRQHCRERIGRNPPGPEAQRRPQDGARESEREGPSGDARPSG